MEEPGDRRRRTAPGRDGATKRSGHRRLPGVDLRPGAVKQARAEVGLSLAAAWLCHCPAIYPIETGTCPCRPPEHIVEDWRAVEFFPADQSGNTDETKTI